MRTTLDYNDLLSMFDSILQNNGLYTIDNFTSAFLSLSPEQKNSLYTHKDYLHNTLLMECIERQEVEFSYALIDLGFDVNVPNCCGVNSLINAIKYNQEELALKLIDLTTDLDFARSTNGKKNGDTALIYATSKGMIKVVEKLVESGADIFYRNEFHQTALFYCLKKEENHLDIFNYLLSQYKEKSYINALTGLTIPEIIFRHGQKEHLNIIASHNLDYPNLTQKTIDILKETTSSTYGFKGEVNKFETFIEMVYYWDKLKNMIKLNQRLTPKEIKQKTIKI